MFSVSLLQNIFLFFCYYACRDVVVFSELHIYSETYIELPFPFCFFRSTSGLHGYSNNRIYSFTLQLLNTLTIFGAKLLIEIIDQGVWSRHNSLTFCTLYMFLPAFLFPHRVKNFLNKGNTTPHCSFIPSTSQPSSLVWKKWTSH